MKNIIDTLKIHFIDFKMCLFLSISVLNIFMLKLLLINTGNI